MNLQVLLGEDEAVPALTPAFQCFARSAGCYQRYCAQRPASGQRLTTLMRTNLGAARFFRSMQTHPDAQGRDVETLLEATALRPCASERPLRV